MVGGTEKTGLWSPSVKVVKAKSAKSQGRRVCRMCVTHARENRLRMALRLPSENAPMMDGTKIGFSAPNREKHTVLTSFNADFITFAPFLPSI